MLDLINPLNQKIKEYYISCAEKYKRYINKDRLDEISDYDLEEVAEGGYIHDYGFGFDWEGIKEISKPYYEYLKQDLENRKNNIQEEYNINEQQLLLENNNISQYDYTNTIQPQYTYSYDYNTYYTPYSYEYDPYIDYYNNGYYYNTYNDTINTTVDLTNNNTNTFNDSITNVLDMIKSYKDRVNIFKPIKKKIINYISNYRPMYNKEKCIIEPVLIE